MPEQAHLTELSASELASRIRNGNVSSLQVVAAHLHRIEAVNPQLNAVSSPRSWARPESTSLTRWRPWGASTLGADDIECSLFEWERLRRAFLQFMADFDLIVCPAGAEAVPARDASTAEDFIYTLPFSLTGYPSVGVRAGTTRDGLPIGVQIVARPWQDHVALAAARIVQAATCGWQQPRAGGGRTTSPYSLDPNEKRPTDRDPVGGA